VIENIEMTAPKTRTVVEFLKKVDASGKRVLFMLGAVNPVFFKSTRNLDRVQVKPFAECNVYDVLLAEKLVIEKSVLDQLEQK